MKYLLLLVPLVLVSCGPTVSVDFDSKADFSQYHTYGFYPSIDSGLNELDNKRIVMALDSLLPQKGLHPSGTPQILINFYARETLVNSRNSIGIGIGSGGRNVGVGVSGGIPIGGHEIEQQLTIDFVESQGDALIWQGILEGHFKEKSSPEQKETYYFNAVRKILNKYPPASK